MKPKSPGRRAARTQRASARCSGDGKVIGDVLAEVRHLKMHFPIPSGKLFARGGLLKAVDDVSFTMRRGRDARPGRRVGLGKVDGRSLPARPLQAHRRARSLLEDEDVSAADAKADEADPRERPGHLPGSIQLTGSPNDRGTDPQRAVDHPQVGGAATGARGGGKASWTPWA